MAQECTNHEALCHRVGTLSSLRWEQQQAQHAGCPCQAVGKNLDSTSLPIGLKVSLKASFYIGAQLGEL
eukprot:CAMPEP_0202894174 /NCGR_PEP_ID=MMETSP1392-20130828/3619_1 /ASSEMBLY_ACC=CAM_ASM_000868 /TAXON_ID=225041 /ORGANISM="Chlamydomonas chlamydogama, Strain SAG 11-48b" /LENGTH=68 /DNA_ID=CAMNT_0049578775 /DNA_START=821 /DNA_END=1027 /DNA_ORIENTATION=+